MHAICIAAYGSPLLMNLWKESKRKKQHKTSSKVAEFYDTFDGCLLYGAFMDGHLAGGLSITDRFYVSISFASNVPENHGNFAASN